VNRPLGTLIDLSAIAVVSGMFRYDEWRRKVIVSLLTRSDLRGN